MFTQKYSIYSYLYINTAEVLDLVQFMPRISGLNCDKLRNYNIMCSHTENLMYVSKSVWIEVPFAENTTVNLSYQNILWSFFSKAVAIKCLTAEKVVVGELWSHNIQYITLF